MQKHHSDKRMSQIVVHGDTVYLAGQVGNVGDDIAAQTRTSLESAEKLLKEVGSDKSKMLSVTVWVKDIENDFAAMNEVWEDFFSDVQPPARAACQAAMATPDYLVEIIVTAAL